MLFRSLLEIGAPQESRPFGDRHGDQPEVEAHVGNRRALQMDLDGQQKNTEEHQPHQCNNELSFYTVLQVGREAGKYFITHR